MNVRTASNAYQTVRKAALVEGATPHSLILQLYEGALKFLSVITDENELEDRTRLYYLDKTIAVVQELQSSLYEPDSNELSANLFLLYIYIIDQLTLAKKRDENADLDTCVQILETLKSSWEEISPTQSPQ